MVPTYNIVLLRSISKLCSHVVSSLQIFQVQFCICQLYFWYKPRLSSLTWSSQYLTKKTNNKLLSFQSSSASFYFQILCSEPCSLTISICILLLMWKTKFNVNQKKEDTEKVKSLVRFNLYIFRTENKRLWINYSKISFHLTWK